MTEQGTNIATLICCIIIGGAFLVFFYITKTAKEDFLLKHKRTVDAFPSIISTLGVLGTFLGITIGLSGFDVNDLTRSIPILLGGLKTAFYTSLGGMLGSLILRHFCTDIKFDKEDGGVSSTDAAIRELGKGVREMSSTLVTTLIQNRNEMKQMGMAQASFFNQILEINKSLVGSATNIDTKLARISLVEGEQTATLNTLASHASNFEASNKRLEESLGEIVDAQSANTSTFDEMNEELKKFSQILRSEVDEIEDKMESTNKLLTNKFDEFSELLKKSNTEALVNVMKKVTEEFQKQMNDLISRLVQENFAKLNESVEKLNTWQEENKTMIESLTKQYHQMEQDFEGTSTVMLDVSNYANQLVGNGGKLAQLVSVLKEVMVDDQKFIEISRNLSESASLAKDGMEKQDAITNKLNEWVQGVQVFKDDVQRLINKLEELDRIRNYNEQFWQGTKKSLEEGVGIIQSGSEELNKQILNIDKSFYNRLSATLASLDNLIATMLDRH
jgi:chromosome segregation ATPase|nr:MAG TPA: chromosome segregation ATPase [Caudoviricetes sp.]